jgi:cobalt-zinc-cadmium efflux system outer membrane protein
MTLRIIIPLIPLALMIGVAPAAAAEGVAIPPPVAGFLSSLFADHPRTRVFDAVRSRAQAEAEAAGQSLYNPDLEFDAAPVAGSPPETALSTQFSAAVRLTLDVTGKSGLKGRQGEETARATEADLRLSRTMLAADLLAALAGREAAAARRAVAARQAGLAAQILDIAVKRQKAGELPAVEFGAAQLANADAKRALDETELALVEAEEGLRATCLCMSENVPALPSDLSPPPILTEERIAGIAQERPESEAARRRVAAARQGFDLTRAQRIPDPTLRLGGSSEGEEKRVLIGLSIPIPVLNSGAAEVGAAGRALAEAEATAHLATLDSAQAIRKAARAYRRAFEADRSWQGQAVPAVTSQSALLTRLWRAGDLSATDLIVQLRETARSESAAIEARASAWTAYAALIRAATLDPVLGSIRHE